MTDLVKKERNLQETKKKRYNIDIIKKDWREGYVICTFTGH